MAQNPDNNEKTPLHKKKISSILSRGDIKYFDESVFKRLNMFNIFFVSVLSIIYFADISKAVYENIEPRLITLGGSLLIDRYREFETVSSGRGAFFLVANAILLIATVGLLVVILLKFIAHKERLPFRLTKYNMTTFPAFIIIISLFFYFLFFSDVTCSTCGSISYIALNSPLMIVLIVGFYSIIIEFFIQIFCAASIALTPKDYENGL